MRRNIYFKEDAEKNLETLSKNLNKSMSDVISIALEFYLLSVSSRADVEFDKCYKQLTKSVEYLQACRDYGNGEGNTAPEPWTDHDDEILELLFKAHEPLMYYNNEKIFREHPEYLDEDGNIV